MSLPAAVEREEDAEEELLDDDEEATPSLRFSVPMDEGINRRNKRQRRDRVHRRHLGVLEGVDAAPGEGDGEGAEGKHGDLRG